MNYLNVISVLKIKKKGFFLTMDPLTEYTKETVLFTMQRYKANTETQEIAQYLENKCVQPDYIASIPVLINLTFCQWQCNF